jgi:UDP-N-acetylglucosamine 2-epimerase (non-hydrolysing)/GDP/UDP-N,N'-diacetylbacillosamine 2-epimerase (hydrolysing)
VIDVGYDTREIVAAVRKALQDRDFRKKVSSCENPYGDGKAGKRIVKVLSKVELGKKLLEKRMTY